MVVPKEKGAAFNLQEYYKHPEKYEGVFERFLSQLTVLVNCVYWDARYPRLVTQKYLRDAWNGTSLKVIGDISCDIEGGVEATLKATTPGDPCFVYEAKTGRAVDGLSGEGPVIMAVDILPSELPKDASIYFSYILMRFIPDIAKADYSKDFSEVELPPPIKRAVILHHGQFTPDYKYMEKFVK